MKEEEREKEKTKRERKKEKIAYEHATTTGLIILSALSTIVPVYAD